MSNYELVSATQQKTARGANYWNLIVFCEDVGMLECTYFGNTKPTKVEGVKVSSRNHTNYFMAIIQPHTSRDMKSGKFKEGWRTE